jgi:hypothetical protein
VRQAFDSAVYTSHYEKVSLAARYQEIAARILGNGEGGSQAGAPLAAQQLTFDFFAESRREELALFQQRTDTTADRLDGGRRAVFLAQREQVAVRFSLSVDVSSVVLDGYARGAEQAAAADEGEGGGDALDRLMAFANDILHRMDDMLNKAMEALNGAFGKNSDFSQALDVFIADLKESGIFDIGAGRAGTPSAEDQTVTAMAREVAVQMEFSFEYTSETVEVVEESDPITLDLDGDGIELTSYRDGARFDITGTGQAARTAFVTGGDAFLAFDRNGNGTIDDGTELFGDQRGAANGFEELRRLDTNGDGRISAADRDFDALRLFRDNGNGRTEAGELLTLAEAGVAEISLGYRHVNEVARGGNRIAQAASFTRTDGTRGRAVDAILNYTA